MKTLFEILNKLKLIHDFLMGPAEASRIADCFSHDEQTSPAGVREKRRPWVREISSIFSPTQILRNQYPVQSDLMLLHITWWHLESDILKTCHSRELLSNYFKLCGQPQHGWTWCWTWKGRKKLPRVITPTWMSNWNVVETYFEVLTLLMIPWLQSWWVTSHLVEKYG